MPAETAEDRVAEILSPYLIGVHADAIVREVARTMREYGDERAREARAAAIEEIVRGTTQHIAVLSGVLLGKPHRDDVLRALITLNKEFRALADTSPQPQPVPAPEWVLWRGGPRPIAPEALVEVRLRNGEVLSSSLSTASMWPWAHRGRPDDVMAFRVLPSELP